MPTETFRKSADWKFDPLANAERPEINQRYEKGHVQIQDRRKWHSFSGHERNHLFVNKSGTSFVDASPLSGLDNIADGRSFATFDFDRDGRQDIALVNANYPLLNVYRNEIGPPREGGANFVAIRLIGGNRFSQPSSVFSNRDGVGASVTINVGDTAIHRELRFGEGFAAQNSNTLIIGIGSPDQVSDLTVRWPSGRESRCGAFAANQLVTVFEDENTPGVENGFRLQPYRVSPAAFTRNETQRGLGSVHLNVRPDQTAGTLRMMTTMATWCDACKHQIPQLAHLRSTFADTELSMLGVPIDPIDTSSDLEDYKREFSPPYKIASFSNEEVSSIQQALRAITRSEALPSTLITNSKGSILGAFDGVPSASAVRELLARSNE